MGKIRQGLAEHRAPTEGSKHLQGVPYIPVVSMRATNSHTHSPVCCRQQRFLNTSSLPFESGWNFDCIQDGLGKKFPGKKSKIHFQSCNTDELSSNTFQPRHRLVFLSETAAARSPMAVPRKPPRFNQTLVQTLPHYPQEYEAGLFSPLPHGWESRFALKPD